MSTNLTEASTPYPLASLGRRLAAAALDGAFFIAVIIALVIAANIIAAWAPQDSTLAGTIWIATTIASPILYILGNAVLLQGLSGATLGKHLMGIDVVNDATDAPIGFNRALLRAAITYLIDLPTLIGPALIVLTPHGRTLADRTCHTLVINQLPRR
ncbi:RDD family protein [Gordonia soli]|uniref:RDD domain-containing protein n=1 Tax=Gordonia soli NBRC 108243 TaxID=1223545 RepID=M0QFT8_9ACTN|nr:RDD family protein [Gordonia soli]GAC67319.1 hypothetical protein GS4_07_00680 [Gordonia soli NBRC 108243]